MRASLKHETCQVLLSCFSQQAKPAMGLSLSQVEDTKNCMGCQQHGMNDMISLCMQQTPLPLQGNWAGIAQQWFVSEGMHALTVPLLSMVHGTWYMVMLTG